MEHYSPPASSARADGDFTIRLAIHTSGERIPLLIDKATGVPHYDATAYSIGVLRSRNVASATIDQALRAIMVTEMYLVRNQINLEARMENGQFLTVQEISGLTSFYKRPLSEIRKEIVDTVGFVQRFPKVRSLEMARMNSKSLQQKAEINASSAGIRLHYSHNYLKWRVDRFLDQGPSHKHHQVVKAITELRLQALAERAYRPKHRDTIGRREGLDKEEVKRLLDVIRPSSAVNPFKSPFVKARNQLLVHLLLRLGQRRGEILGLRCENFNFLRNQLLIERRPDDPDDTRRDEPNTKTKDKIIQLHPTLAEAVHTYIIRMRAKIPGAEQNPFLLVAENSGAPLSKAAVAKVFKTLRGVEGMPKELYPHLLRHTWNDEFSETADAKKLSPEDEQKIRSDYMGWHPNSGTALTYTKRYVRKRSNEIGLQLQELLVKDDHEQ